LKNQESGDFIEGGCIMPILLLFYSIAFVFLLMLAIQGYGELSNYYVVEETAATNMNPLKSIAKIASPFTWMFVGFFGYRNWDKLGEFYYWLDAIFG
jgi:hypothetical protein